MGTTLTEGALPGLRLLQLVSPTLPVGAFTYSQGLEQAVECGWVQDGDGLAAWVGDLLRHNMTFLEVPVLARLYRASAAGDAREMARWCRFLLASRETRELREEERNRGRALATLLPELGVPVGPELQPLLRGCQLAGFAHAARHWRIPLVQAAEGYVWGWLENLVLCGVKSVPLGQTTGQRLITRLAEEIPALTAQGLALPDAGIGASSMAQAIASSRHETQYTRIYRS